MLIEKCKLVVIGNSEGFSIPVDDRKEMGLKVGNGKFYNLEVTEHKEVRE